jgi:hypothetical protein
MRNKLILLGCLTFIFVMPTAAQESVTWLEVSGNYSYFRFAPTASREIPPRNLNGGGGSVNFNLTRNFGIKAELMGYESTLWRTTFGTPVVTSQGTIPAGEYHSQGNMFTYGFGPTYTYRTEVTNIFGEVLFGGSRTNGYAEWVKAIDASGGTVAAIPIQHPFTMIVGGGVDINITKNIAFRPLEMDYVLTHYSNPVTFGNHQNSFRFVTGFVFRFGEK